MEASGTAHELYVYEGVDHADITNDALMLERVRAWYTTHGVLEP